MHPFKSIGWWLGWAIGVVVAIALSVEFEIGMWSAVLGFLLTLVGSQVGMAIQVHRRQLAK